MESGQAELVATDYAFDNNVWIEPWPGHTPGHVCVVVRSPQASVILSGDIMHTPLQCAEPQLNSCFCVDAETARATRRRFLETSVDKPVMVIPAHFPTSTAGWIRRMTALSASIPTASAKTANARNRVPLSMFD